MTKTASRRAQPADRPLARRIAVLKPGDHVYIDGTREEGTVREVHPHEILVRVQVAGGHEDRKYTYEDLRLDPTMKEASHFYDH
jgi:hypothetical protein